MLWHRITFNFSQAQFNKGDRKTQDATKEMCMEHSAVAFGYQISIAIRVQC